MDDEEIRRHLERLGITGEGHSIRIDPETGKVQKEHWYGREDTGVVIDPKTGKVQEEHWYGREDFRPRPRSSSRQTPSSSDPPTPGVDARAGQAATGSSSYGSAGASQRDSSLGIIALLIGSLAVIVGVYVICQVGIPSAIRPGATPQQGVSRSRIADVTPQDTRAERGSAVRDTTAVAEYDIFHRLPTGETRPGHLTIYGNWLEFRTSPESYEVDFGHLAKVEVKPWPFDDWMEIEVHKPQQWFSFSLTSPDKSKVRTIAANIQDRLSRWRSGQIGGASDHQLSKSLVPQPPALAQGLWTAIDMSAGLAGPISGGTWYGFYEHLDLPESCSGRTLTVAVRSGGRNLRIELWRGAIDRSDHAWWRNYELIAVSTGTRETPELQPDPSLQWVITPGLYTLFFASFTASTEIPRASISVKLDIDRASEPPPGPGLAATPQLGAAPVPLVPPSGAVAAPRAPHRVSIPAGTLLTVRLTESLSSDRQLAGDTFAATLDKPLVVEGFVIAERGARLQGRVLQAEKASRTRGVPLLAIDLTRLHTSDGQEVAIETERFIKHGGASAREGAATVSAGVAIGAAIGALAGGGKGAAIGPGAGGAAGASSVLTTPGKAAVLPSETRISFRLRAPVTLTERIH